MLHKLKSACFIRKKPISEQVRFQVFRKSRRTNRQVPSIRQTTYSNTELSTGRMDPRVGSGRVTILPEFGGSGRVSTSDFSVFYWLFLGA